MHAIDIRNPTNCVRVGGYQAAGSANAVVVSGNYAYVAYDSSGLHVLNVNNPTNCVLVSVLKTPGPAVDVAVSEGRVYIAMREAGLLVVPTIPGFQFSMRIEATPGLPFTLEAATDLSALNPWTPLVTTNVATMPFDFVDFDVKSSEKAQKFYRVRQP